MLLKIEDLYVNVNNKPILKGVHFSLNPGEVHAIMGPNGSGKSTLARAVAGHPSCEVTGGTMELEVHFKMKNLLDLEPDERAREGVFLAFQYPVEIPGVTNLEFLQSSYNALAGHQGFPELDSDAFLKWIQPKMELLGMEEKFLHRFVNTGFSGGEKKRNEILQMATLSPRIAFLDETDSGLDVDALKIVGKGVNQLKSGEGAIVLITHYQRLLDYVKPDFVHILADGKIVETGGAELALKLEKQGYNWLSELK